MSTLINDIKYGIRQLIKSPGFTTVAVLTLALGIGANTAFFGVLNTTLLRPLPYPQSGQLFHIQERHIKSNRDTSVSYPDFIDWKRMQTSFTALMIYRPDSTLNLMTETGTERVPIAQVDHDFLKVLGYQPVLGRDFTAEDDRTGAPLAVLLTHGAWSRRFSSDPGVLGRTVQVDGQSTARRLVVAALIDPGCRAVLQDRISVAETLVLIGKHVLIKTVQVVFPFWQFVTVSSPRG
jgi:hypothetical protein